MAEWLDKIERFVGYGVPPSRVVLEGGEIARLLRVARAAESQMVDLDMMLTAIAHGDHHDELRIRALDMQRRMSEALADEDQP